MMNAEQIFQAIQSLSLSERRGLLDRLNRDASMAPEAPADEHLDLIGFLADDPDLHGIRGDRDGSGAGTFAHRP